MLFICSLPDDVNCFTKHIQWIQKCYLIFKDIGWNLRQIYVLQSKEYYWFAKVYAREIFLFASFPKVNARKMENFANLSIRKSFCPRKFLTLKVRDNTLQKKWKWKLHYVFTKNSLLSKQKLKTRWEYSSFFVKFDLWYSYQVYSYIFICKNHRFLCTKNTGVSYSCTCIFTSRDFTK